MSRPRLLRTETVIPRAARLRANRFTWRSGGRVKGMPGAALSGIRFTLARSPRSRAPSRAASAAVSLTPSSSTYSKVIRSRCLRGKRRQAATRSASRWLRLVGMRAWRAASVVACNDTARFGIQGSSASRSNPAARPTVDRVTRRGVSASPLGAASIRNAFIVAA